MQQCFNCEVLFYNTSNMIALPVSTRQTAHIVTVPGLRLIASLYL